jgi:hypothetical protein
MIDMLGIRIAVWKACYEKEVGQTLTKAVQGLLTFFLSRADLTNSESTSGKTGNLSYLKTLEGVRV